MQTANPKKARRSGAQLPECESVWGLVAEDSAYNKLIITAFQEPSLSRARTFCGPSATFSGRITPALGSMVLENAGMRGHRHMSRIPVNDLRVFGDKFMDLVFAGDDGSTYSGTQLEAVFGLCPARVDPLKAYHSRYMCFNLTGRAFSKEGNDEQSQSLPITAVQPQARHAAEPVDSETSSTAIAGYFQEARSALETLSGSGAGEGHAADAVEHLRQSLKKLEGTMVLRSATVPRVQYADEDCSVIAKRIGGYNYQPLFLLDAVLLSDNLREPGLLQSTILKSFQLVAHSDLYEYFDSIIPQSRLPRAACLYDARITLDMCTMLWSREHLLSLRAEKSRPWVLPLRCDSSPQFGRDFLVTQADYIQYGPNASSTTITKRLLPIQCVGSRAGSEGHKLDKLLFSLTLESESVAWSSFRFSDFGFRIGLDDSGYLLRHSLTKPKDFERALWPDSDSD